MNDVSPDECSFHTRQVGKADMRYVSILPSSVMIGHRGTRAVAISNWSAGSRWSGFRDYLLGEVEERGVLTMIDTARNRGLEGSLTLSIGHFYLAQPGRSRGADTLHLADCCGLVDCDTLTRTRNLA